MKYEFKATGRIYLPLFGALMIVAIVSRIFLSLSFEIPSIIGIAVAVFMIIAIFVIVLIVTIQRFYKNLLTSEGYLMLTLPVNTDQIIWSKLLISSIWNIGSMLIVFLAIAIMAITSFNLSDCLSAIHAFFREYGISDAQRALYIIEFIALMLITLAGSILTLYACMSSSLLFNKHRVLISFGAYIAFYIVGQIISGIAVSVVTVTNLGDAFFKLTLFGQIQSVFTILLLVNLVVAAFMYFLTRFMLKNKMNLE